MLTKRHLWLAVAGAAVLIAMWPAPSRTMNAQGSAASADRLLNGAIDIHLHIDPRTYGADTSTLRLAKSKGVRGVVIKNHYEPTVDVSLLLQHEISGLEIFGGIDLNFIVGGINPATVEHMGQVLTGATGFRRPPSGARRTGLVWLTTFDSETAVKAAKESRPFITVSRNGELVPQLKELIGILAKYDLVLATGHNSPAEALLMLREGRTRGVKHMVVTHAMDNPIFMKVAQIQEAVKLGALIEFDYRLMATHKDQTDAIRQVGPEHVILSEFMMPAPNTEPLKHPGVDGIGQFAEMMRSRGFTDSELEMMLKRNPARLLGLADVPGQ